MNATVTTYNLTASNGRHIRKATKVTFDNGQEVKFTEKMTKGEAIEQAKRQICKHPAPRIYSWFAYDGTLCAACCDCGAVLAGGA
jgi:hypothetical protein